MADIVDNFSDLQELGIDLDFQISSLTKEFNRAAQHLQSLLTVTNSQTLLTLYGYYKQGLDGPCNAPKPYWYDMKGKAKWDAWNKLGSMSKDEAMLLYIETIKSIDPSFESDAIEQGVRVSSMIEHDVLRSEEMTITDYIKVGDVKEVEHYLNNHKDAVNILDKEGLALVHWAVDSGFLDIVKLLISAGADVNLQDADGLTPLHYASNCGHSDCVKFLLEKGAYTNILDNDNNSPLDVADNPDIQKLLSGI